MASLLYRKRIRTAIKTFLSDNAAGFNARLASAATDFEISPFTINFARPSQNFIESYLELDKQPEIIERSILRQFPAMALYTTDAEDTGEPRSIRWNGPVIACLDIVTRYREGMEGELSAPNTEDVMDAMESSVFQCLNEPSLQWPSGVRYSRVSMATRGGLWQLADGFQQVGHISFRFGADDV